MGKCQACDTASNQLSIHNLCKSCQKKRGALQYARQRAWQAKKLAKLAVKPKGA